jgi:16S rRNA (guanine966-N2)-methyltransferase
MMRVVAGRFRGRALQAPDDMNIRPTADRVRENMFNIMAHGIADFAIEGVRVIDLFAGTGALGIEAVSRGASYCLFVEETPDARALIRKNVEALGLTGETRIFRRDATDLGPAGHIEPYGLAFLDPPYGKGLGEKALLGLAKGKWLTPGALCIFEERVEMKFEIPSAFELLDVRTYGDTDIRFLRYAATA